MGKRKKQQKKRQAPRPQAAAPAPAAPATAGGWPAAIAISVCAAVLYLWTARHGYTLDDVSVVLEHRLLQSHDWWAVLWEPYWPSELGSGASNWRPLASVLLCLEDGLAGESAPALHHTINALLHGGVTLALYPLACRLAGPGGWAWAACALFAVHPAHTEAVAPVVGRLDLLAALGSLVMVEAWLRWRCDGAGPRWAWIAAVGCAVGLGGKESAAPLILALPLAERWVGGRSWSEVRGGPWRGAMPLAVVGVAYLVLRASVLGDHSFAHGGAPELGPVGRLVFAARNTVLSTALLFAPVRFHHLLTSLPSDAPYTFPTPSGLGSLLWVLLALPIWTGWWWLRGRSPRAAFCWVASLLVWAPTSGLVPAAAGMSLRFLFLPSAFVACAAVAGGRALMERRPRIRPAVLAVAGCWAVAALALTAWRVPAWKNNGTFYRAVLREEPRCYTAAFGLGSWIAKHDRDLAAARGWFEQALTIAGRNERGLAAWMNLAQTWEWPPGGGERYSTGAELDRAVQEYRALLEKIPAAWGAHLNVAVCYERLQRPADALRHLDRTRALKRDHPEAPIWLAKTGDLARTLGQAAEARRRYREAATEAVARGDRESARRWLGQAMTTGPSPAEAAAIAAQLSALDR